MKKIFIVIVSGYLAGIMGALTVMYFIKAPAGRLPSGSGQMQPAMITHQNTDHSGEARSFPAAGGSARTASGDVDNINSSFADASSLATRSVVYIKTVTEHGYSNTWYDWFFGDRTSKSYISTGSGVIYTSDGYIVTNNHVVEDADEIEVIHNKHSFKAKLVGTDPSTDVALLKVDAKNLPNISIGSARDLRVGEWVIAVGNPFNLTSTVTSGIVSAKGRQINILKSNFPIESFIQTDAAINPGNSGGALVNINGELVGINSAILSQTGSYAGYGFAVPVEIVSKVVEDLMKYGEVQKAFFGGETVDIDQSIGEKLNLKDWNGVVLQNIQQDGAAAKAGLKEGDIISGIDNDKVGSKSDFEEIVSYHSPGDQVDIAYKRNGEPDHTIVTLTNAQGTTSILKHEVYSSRTLGADLEVVPKVERDLLKIDHGVRLTKIKGGLMSRLSIEEGFIITYINKIPIKNPQDLVDILSRIRGRVYIEGVNREGVKGYYSYFF